MAGGRRRRWAVLAAAGVLGATGVVASAAATPGDDHQVTICHVTESVQKGYVVITVDVAAFDGEGSNDHTQHVSWRSGMSDAPYVDGVCQWDGPGG